MSEFGLFEANFFRKINKPSLGGGLIPDSRECEGFHPPEPPQGLANNYKYKPKRKIRYKQI